MQNPTLVLSSVLPFPPLPWWKQVMKTGIVVWDVAEHFEKMSFRNRYYIAAAHGKHCLSIPLTKGREQRTSMMDVIIADRESWQQQHWRTLFSAYNRSPYFEYYKDELETLFLRKHERLIDFNLATVHWAKKQLGIDIDEKITDHYQETDEDVWDIRNMKPRDLDILPFTAYNQVFADRNGFIPHLSILDLLFNEGNYATTYLRKPEDGF